MHVALSRSGPRKPDGSKVYVQDLLWDQRAEISQAILEKRASVYVCGDGRHMSKDVEAKLATMLGEAKGGSKDVEGMAELKALKDRSRLLLDVWVRPRLFVFPTSAPLTSTCPSAENASRDPGALDRHLRSLPVYSHHLCIASSCPPILYLSQLPFLSFTFPFSVSHPFA